MQKFATLLTCHNRKNKTISALNALHKAFETIATEWQMDVYLTDDGSSDGTAEKVQSLFPNTKILKGNGELYWAGGMRNSWQEALMGDYNAYLLLNDDTNVYPNLFKQVMNTDDFSLKNYNVKGVYVGTTVDKETKKISYGGSIIKNRFLATTKRLPLNEHSPQKCELGNANIMWVPKNVVDKIGILSTGYIHGMADYDYTLKATKNKIPVLILPGISGECTNDNKDPYTKFVKLPIKERIKMLYSPIGLDFRSQLYHMKKHFPIRLPFFFIMGWMKVIFPNLYVKGFQKSRKN